MGAQCALVFSSENLSQFAFLDFPPHFFCLFILFYFLQFSTFLFSVNLFELSFCERQDLAEH